jgi:hypothetical protein
MSTIYFVVLQVQMWMRLDFEYYPLCFLTQSFSNPCRDLSNNQLAGSIPDSIGNLSQLQTLYVEWQFLSLYCKEKRG